MQQRKKFIPLLESGTTFHFGTLLKPCFFIWKLALLKRGWTVSKQPETVLNQSCLKLKLHFLILKFWTNCFCLKWVLVKSKNATKIDNRMTSKFVFISCLINIARIFCPCFSFSNKIWGQFYKDFYNSGQIYKRVLERENNPVT